MKKILFTLCLLLGATSISAQPSSQSEETRTAELREKIGIDYSMRKRPIFTSCVDPG